MAYVELSRLGKIFQLKLRLRRSRSHNCAFAVYEINLQP